MTSRTLARASAGLRDIDPVVRPEDCVPHPEEEAHVVAGNGSCMSCYPVRATGQVRIVIAARRAAAIETYRIPEPNHAFPWAGHLSPLGKTQVKRPAAGRTTRAVNGAGRQMGRLPSENLLWPFSPSACSERVQLHKGVPTDRIESCRRQRNADGRRRTQARRALVLCAGA
jgi:hypothetical protein